MPQNVRWSWSSQSMCAGLTLVVTITELSSVKLRTVFIVDSRKIGELARRRSDPLKGTCQQAWSGWPSTGKPAVAGRFAYNMARLVHPRLQSLLFIPWLMTAATHNWCAILNDQRPPLLRPRFEFDVDKINFGTVSFGFLNSRTDLRPSRWAPRAMTCPKMLLASDQLQRQVYRARYTCLAWSWITFSLVKNGLFAISSYMANTARSEFAHNVTQPTNKEIMYIYI